MPVSALGENLLNSLTGNIPKAVLFVRKYTENIMTGADADAATKQATLQKRLLQSTQGVLSGLGANMPFSDLSTLGTDLGYIAMRVQYNPASLYLDTAAGEREVDNGSLNNMMNNQIMRVNSPTLTTLGMQLVFDAMDVQDAFGMSSLELSTGAAMSAIARATGLKGELSVRNQVEGLVSCLLSPNTRKVIFAWSTMIFPGELFQVNAKYTMFNKKGNPVRATVEVTIQQGQDELKSAVGTYWDKAFDKAFGNSSTNAITGGASELSKKTNNALMNLNLGI